MKVTVVRLSVTLNMMLLVATSILLTRVDRGQISRSNHVKALYRVHTQLHGEGANLHNRTTDHVRNRLALQDSSLLQNSSRPHHENTSTDSAASSDSVGTHHTSTNGVATNHSIRNGRRAAGHEGSHDPTQLNMRWWQQQFRPVENARLPADDPLLQHGTLESELFQSLARPPLDDVLANYVQMHKDVVSQQSRGSMDKVVIVSPNAQMANRLRITVYALIVGILFDKAVHVHFNDGWFAAINVSLNDILVPAVDIMAISLHQKRGVEMDMRKALCHDWNTIRSKNVGISLNGNSYLTELLTHNANVQSRVVQVFGNYTDYYRMIFTRFFRPSPSILDRLETFRHTHRLLHKLVVGLHVRSGGDFRQPMSSRDWGRYRDCAEMMTARLKGREAARGVLMQKKDVVWLVVTDTKKARMRSMKEFQSNTHEADVLFYDEFLMSKHKQGVQNAFIDMLLVTFADARVLSPCSSYSEFAFTMAGATGDSVFVEAASRNGLRNCYGKRQAVGGLPFCYRPQSLEPSLEELDSLLEQNPSCISRQ